MTEETSWPATAAQVAALQVALTWMRAAPVRELNTLDEDHLRSAEDDLVWVVTNLPDRRLTSVLVLPLADRTATIALLRDHAAQQLLGSPATSTPTPAATPTATPTPTPAVDSRPDVAADALVRYQRRLHVAMRSVSPSVRDDLHDLRDAGSVHGLGAVGSLLEWTQQQGERGQELLNSWDGAGAIYSAALRSVIAGTAVPHSYRGVLDSCVRKLRTESDDDGLTVKEARLLARSEIALRIDPYGVLLPTPVTTATATANSATSAASPAKSNSPVAVASPTTSRSPVAVASPAKSKSPVKVASPAKSPAKSASKPTSSASTCPGVTTAQAKANSAMAFCSATD